MNDNTAYNDEKAETFSEIELLEGLKLDKLKLDNTLKQEAKEQRQMLKLQCLEISLRGAIATGDLTSKSIVEVAKAFYAFVRT